MNCCHIKNLICKLLSRIKSISYPLSKDNTQKRGRKTILFKGLIRDFAAPGFSVYKKELTFISSLSFSNW